MEKRNKTEETSRANQDELTAVIRAGARKLIAQALEAEVTELVATFGEEHDASGRARVVRNGYQPVREIQTGIGPVTVQVPKVRSRQGHAVQFHSALVPPYVRKSRSLETALPWLYLKGISTGEMQAALEVLVGPEAKGLSASTVARLKQTWRAEYETWRQRRFEQERWVYIWVDGIYSGLRAGRRFDVQLLVEIEFFFKLSSHDACHSTRLSHPAANLVGNARQALRAEHDQPDQAQYEKFRKTDAGHRMCSYQLSSRVSSTGVFSKSASSCLDSPICSVVPSLGCSVVASLASSASFTAERNPLTALPRSEPSERRRLVPNIASTITSTINNCTGPMLENII